MKVITPEILKEKMLAYLANKPSYYTQEHGVAWLDGYRACLEDLDRVIDTLIEARKQTQMGDK